MTTVAIIPASLLKEVLRFGTGGFDSVTCQKFGYARHLHMTGAVVSQSGIKNVTVGSLRPNAHVGYSFKPTGKRFECSDGKFYVLPA